MNILSRFRSGSQDAVGELPVTNQATKERVDARIKRGKKTRAWLFALAVGLGVSMWHNSTEYLHDRDESEELTNDTRDHVQYLVLSSGGLLATSAASQKEKRRTRTAVNDIVSEYGRFVLVPFEVRHELPVRNQVNRSYERMLELTTTPISRVTSNERKWLVGREFWTGLAANNALKAASGANVGNVALLGLTGALVWASSHEEDRESQMLSSEAHRSIDMIDLVERSVTYTER